MLKSSEMHVIEGQGLQLVCAGDVMGWLGGLAAVDDGGCADGRPAVGARTAQGAGQVGAVECAGGYGSVRWGRGTCGGGPGVRRGRGFAASSGRDGVTSWRLRIGSRIGKRVGTSGLGNCRAACPTQDGGGRGVCGAGGEAPVSAAVGAGLGGGESEGGDSAVAVGEMARRWTSVGGGRGCRGVGAGGGAV